MIPVLSRERSTFYFQLQIQLQVYFLLSYQNVSTEEKLGRGVKISGFDFILYPVAPSSFVTVHSALTKPTGRLPLLSSGNVCPKLPAFAA